MSTAYTGVLPSIRTSRMTAFHDSSVEERIVRGRKIPQNWLKYKKKRKDTDHIHVNVKPYASKVLSCEKEIDNIVAPLAQQDIYELVGEYKFSRQILHKLYGQYKACLNIAATRKYDYKMADGID